MGHETAYCNMVESVGCPVLAARGRETVYLCYAVSEVLQSWWHKNVNWIPKEVPFKRLARASKKYPRCQLLYPRCQLPDFCYQLCTPKGYTIMVMNVWLTSFSFHVNRPSHSWDKAISDSDLETPRLRSWMWSKGKVIQLAQYPIN